MTFYAEFNDRSAAVGEGGYGNYVVFRQVDVTGNVTRTIGYYLQATGEAGTYSLYRHDSADGVLAPDTLPDAATAGTHRRLVRTVKLPPNVKLFRNWRKRGLTLRGQFGTADGHAYKQLEYLQCSLTTRS